MIGVLHSYSRHNPGDGLLVDLTTERLRRLGATGDDLLLVALDPDSFPEHPHRVRLGARGRGLAPELVPAAGRAALLGASGLAQRPIGNAARQLARCDALVAVGGGYLRSPDLISSVGALLNHLPQLVYAARAAVPSLYLPQTIGPLRGPVGRVLRRSVKGIDTVCVRDDWSLAELAGLPRVRRFPDLAVLDIAERWSEIEPAGPDGQVGITGGEVRHAPGYEQKLLGLTQRLGDRATWVAHKTGHRTKSDAVHLERFGIALDEPLPEMLSRRRLSVVVSVWLHGALMSIAAGVPAIHLAYDRKGPGAFGDLGLGDWCHDIRTFDADALAGEIDALLADPRPYWESLAERVTELRETSIRLDELIRKTLAPAHTDRDSDLKT